jgi:hypothetical protein
MSYISDIILLTGLILKMSGVYGSHFRYGRKNNVMVSEADPYGVSDVESKAFVEAAEQFERNVAGPPVRVASFPTEGDICVPATQVNRSPKGKGRRLSVRTISSDSTPEPGQGNLELSLSLSVSQEPLLVTPCQRVKQGQHRNYYVKILVTKWSTALASVKMAAGVEVIYKELIILLEIVYFVANNYNYGNCLKRGWDAVVAARSNYLISLQKRYGNQDMDYFLFLGELGTRGLFMSVVCRFLEEFGEQGVIYGWFKTSVKSSR